MKELNSLNDQELESFFDSFDQILTDITDVFWTISKNIPAAEDAIKSLKRLGKKVVVVCNNTTVPLDSHHKKFLSAGFDVDKDEIVTPTQILISYLKKISLTKEIYVLGMPPLKEALAGAGFKLVQIGPEPLHETLAEWARAGVINGDNIGAVVVDTDLNLTYTNLQRAADLLGDPEVVFVAGALDQRLPIGQDRAAISPGFFCKILEDMTGRVPLQLAKPGRLLAEYVERKYKIEDSRVLFIGDSIAEDMGFATKCGYKKLLVLSGVTGKEALEKWTFPEEYKPDYYVDSWKTVYDLICRIFENKL
jgi:HAD superfamily hydrolase (TIGR01450 family)